MRPLTLSIRNAGELAAVNVGRGRIDMVPLTPDRLSGLTLAEIAATPLWVGNRQQPAGDLFRVAGEVGEELLIEGGVELNRLDQIGAGMSGGAIRVAGSPGRYLGRAMSGGSITVAGDCGIYSGSAMVGGLIRIEGDAGDYLAAAAAGQSLGMRGGTIVVGGSAGDRVGERQRRGTIMVAGSVGRFCGAHMVAGTIAVLGAVGSGVGAGMRRGTIWLAQTPAALPATFNNGGCQELGFLSLLGKSLRDADDRFAALLPGAAVKRLVGDRAAGGLGEVLIQP